MATFDRLAVGSIEDLLRGVMVDEEGSVQLMFHRAEGWEDDPCFVSEAERDKALGLGGIWSLIAVRPLKDTPPDTSPFRTVGRASSLDALLAWVAEHAGG